MTCKQKSIDIYKGFSTNWNHNHLVTVSFDSEISVVGFSAEFTVDNISKRYDDIQNGFAIDLTAEETSQLPVGFLNGSLIIYDSLGNGKPFSTEIPISVRDWADGDIELNGFNITIKASVESDSFDINITTNNLGTVAEQTIIDRIEEHNLNELAHPYIQDLIHAEELNREEADQNLQSSIQILDEKVDNSKIDLENQVQEVDDRLSEKIDNSITGVVGRFSQYVPKTTTINGKKLDRDIVLTSQDVDALPKDTKVEDISNSAQIEAMDSGITSTLVGRIGQNQVNIQQLDQNKANKADTLAGYGILDSYTKQEVNSIVGTEKNERVSVDNSLQNQINANIQRFDNYRISAEQDLIDESFVTKEYANQNFLRQVDLNILLSQKQDNLTQPQLNAVNSGITQSLVSKILKNEADISDINALIPEQASPTNKLADKSFVNSSISTNTAYFIGTFNSLEELEAYSGTLTNNDYAFVIGTDTVGIIEYNRYKYNDSEWLYEYTLNNSSFTSDQWSAINSNITSDDVAQITTNKNDIDELGDQVSGIEEKIPQDASSSNQLATKNDFKNADTILQAQITELSDVLDDEKSKIIEIENKIPTNTNELINGAGFITGINSNDVITALGYTPIQYSMIIEDFTV